MDAVEHSTLRLDLPRSALGATALGGFLQTRLARVFALLGVINNKHLDPGLMFVLFPESRLFSLVVSAGRPCQPCSETLEYVLCPSRGYHKHLNPKLASVFYPTTRLVILDVGFF